MMIIRCPRCTAPFDYESLVKCQDVLETDLATELDKYRRVQEALVRTSGERLLEMMRARILAKRLLRSSISSYEIAQLEEEYPWLGDVGPERSE